MPGETGYGLVNIAQYGANWFLVQIRGAGFATQHRGACPRARHRVVALPR